MNKVILCIEANIREMIRRRIRIGLGEHICRHPIGAQLKRVVIPLMLESHTPIRGGTVHNWVNGVASAERISVRQRLLWL